MVDKRSYCAGKMYAVGIYMTCKTTSSSAVYMLGEHGHFDRPGDPEYIWRLWAGDNLNSRLLAHFLAVFGHYDRFLAHAFRIGFEIQYYQWSFNHVEKKN
jgi:hypothetical protein